MLSESEKKQVRGYVLDAVAGIANRSYQEQVWVRGEGGIVDSYEEALDAILHDGKHMLKNWKEFHILAHQKDVLACFVDQLGQFALEHSSYACFAHTSKWREIMNLAKGVLDAFGWERDPRDIS